MSFRQVPEAGATNEVLRSEPKNTLRLSDCDMLDVLRGRGLCWWEVGLYDFLSALKALSDDFEHALEEISHWTCQV